MKIDRRLNLVLETEAPDGSPVHVHSAPVSRAIWEASYRLITKTMSVMYADGLTPGTGSRVAMMYLKDTAKEMDGSGTNAPGTFARQCSALLNEIWRLTNVISIDKAGRWQTLPFQEMLDKQLMEEDILAEVQNTVTFFTLASWFHKDSERQDLYTLMKAYGGQITSSDSTEYQSLLPIWTRAGSTGAMATASSIPH